MKSFLWRILENAGIGILVFLPIIIVYMIYAILIAPTDRLMNPVMQYLFNREIPFVGFGILLLFFSILGAFVGTRLGGWLVERLGQRFRLLSLLFEAARAGSIGQIIRLLDEKDAPNVIMAPYFRKGAPWPFVILKIFETTERNSPMISGVFIDLPLLIKGGVINLEDTVYVDIPLREAFLFGLTSGAGLKKFSRPPRKVILKNYLQEAKVKKFIQETLPTFGSTEESIPSAQS